MGEKNRTLLHSLLCLTRARESESGPRPVVVLSGEFSFRYPSNHRSVMIMIPYSMGEKERLGRSAGCSQDQERAVWGGPRTHFQLNVKFIADHSPDLPVILIL